jgi:hypothetical protein
MAERDGQRSPSGQTQASAPPALPEWLREALRCPVTGAELEEANGPEGFELVAVPGAEPRLAYPVRDGIPILLEHEARRIE